MKMNPFFASTKELLGVAVASFINVRMRSHLTKEQRIKWVEFTNRRPVWLNAVDRVIRVPTQFGMDVYCDRLSGIGQTLLVEGQWEGLLSRTILAALRPGDIAIDIGANIGYDTLLMSSAVGAEGIVMAFEPELANLAVLLQNQKIAPHMNILVQSMGLADTNGLARISVADDYFSGQPNLRPQSSCNTRPIWTMRLEQVLDSPGLDRIAFLKMDIEGFEFKALRGMGNLLDRIDCLACEVNDQFLKQCGSSAKELFLYMNDQGFSAFVAESMSNDRWREVDAGFGVENIIGTHVDALFVRRIEGWMKSLC